MTATFTAKRKELEALAQLLLRQETVERDGLLRILEDRQHAPEDGSALRDNSPTLSDAA